MKEVKRGRVVLTLAGALMASTMAVPAFAQVTQERLENTHAEPQNWLLPLGDYAGTSYSTLSQIDLSNVGSLRMIANIPIQTALRDTNASNLEGRPIVVDGMMYYNDAWGVMYGVDISDPHNPVIRWVTDPAMDREAGEVLINRAGAVFGDRYLTNLTDGRVVAVDVNTGRFVGKKDQEETILETNMLAAREVPRQLRLRDIGGIIVIDFIDMESEANKKKVLSEIRHYLRKDRSRSKAFAVSDLGLIEVSRKRVRPSLLHFFSEECPYCNGIGKVLSFESLSTKI